MQKLISVLLLSYLNTEVVIALNMTSFSYEREHSIEDRDVKGGPRWRLDETSDDEEDYSQKRATRLPRRTTPARGVRRSRLAIS